MFSLDIIDTDLFLDMPQSTQNLYFHLCMRADDDGFIDAPKKIIKTVGAGDEDMKALVAKNYIISFESGVCVIRHWRIHNYIRVDRYKETLYLSEKEQLSAADNGMYVLGKNVNRMVYRCDTQERVGQDKKVKVSLDGGAKPPQNTGFKSPTVEEIGAYCKERENKVDEQRFFDYYTARGWELGNGRKMKDWKAALRTWENNNVNKPEKKQLSKHTAEKNKSKQKGDWDIIMRQLEEDKED